MLTVQIGQLAANAIACGKCVCTCGLLNEVNKQLNNRADT